MEPLSSEQLNKMYNEAETVDFSLFSEMRSNILLNAGFHHNSKRYRQHWDNICKSKTLNSEVKLLLTKNHIGKIMRHKVNNLLSYCPGVFVGPKDSKEIGDQKAADQCNGVWQDIKKRSDIEAKLENWANDFFVCGEVAVKVFFDKDAGDFLGFHPVFDEETQQWKQVPRFSGDIVFERIFGFNLLRDPNAKEIDQVKYWIVRKFVDREELKIKLAHDPAKVALLESSKDEQFTIFNGVTGEYSRSEKDQVMLREIYFKPCVKYPNGYYAFYTQAGILFEGEIPGGKECFPIHFEIYDEIQTSVRGRSLIKQLRSGQSSINRISSVIGEHQITLGSDKLIISSGSKITNGGTLPGIRAVQVSGPPPTILPGRTGEQYLPLLQHEKAEMYEIGDYFEDFESKDSKKDPYAELFRSSKQKKKLARYTAKFERLLTRIAKTALRLAALYYSDDRLIPGVGVREYINLPEFREINPTESRFKSKRVPMMRRRF